MKFISEIWHPNSKPFSLSKTNVSHFTGPRALLSVHADGEVCISILHEPGEDKYGYERAEERWLPVHTVETIMLSVISMLADPNDSSPANVDAAVSHRRLRPSIVIRVIV